MKNKQRKKGNDENNNNKTVLVDVREIPDNAGIEEEFDDAIQQGQILSRRFSVANLHRGVFHRAFPLPTRTVRLCVDGWDILKRVLGAVVEAFHQRGETEIVRESGFLRHARDAQFARAVGVF